MCTAFVAAFVLPVDRRRPTPATSTTSSPWPPAAPPTGDIGLLQTAIQVQGIAYLAGGLVFGIALFRARVLARWAAALLAVGGVVTVALPVMPDAFYRFLAFPNGIAMIGLGYSLWRSVRVGTTTRADHRPTTRSAVTTAVHE